MSDASFTKSITNVSSFPLYVLFNLDKVCTAFIPFNFLSTNIVCNKGSSNPVWYFSATTNTLNSSPWKYSLVCDSDIFLPLLVLFMLLSVNVSSPSLTSPEKATKTSKSSYPFSWIYLFISKKYLTACNLEAVTNIAFPLPLILFLVTFLNCSTIICVFWEIFISCKLSNFFIILVA